MADGNGFRSHRRATCRVCGGADLVAYLDLGDQPPSNSFIAPERIPDERRFPLVVNLCRDCGMSQLQDVVSSEDIFDDYLYLSSTSKALCRHYQGLVDGVLADLKPAAGALMVDIGCNDGIMLKAYPRGQYRLLGIEPSSAGRYAREAGFEVVAEFFGADLGARLAASHGGASIVTATNVFAHVDDIRGFAAGVRALLAEDGVFIIEFPYLRDMIENLYFDTIYHEHLSYLAITPLDRLFSDAGLRAFRVERQEVGASGPALRLFVCRTEARHAEQASIVDMRRAEADWGITDPAAYRAFAEGVAEVRRRLLDMVADLRAEGASLGGFCAPAKGNTLLNYLGLGPDDLLCVSDNNALKVGKVTPGSHIPIVDDEAFVRAGITHALLLGWNYLDFFLANAEFIKRGGKFIVPVPRPEIRP